MERTEEDVATNRDTPKKKGLDKAYKPSHARTRLQPRCCSPTARIECRLQVLFTKFDTSATARKTMTMSRPSPFSARRPFSASAVCSSIISRLSPRDLNRLTHLLYQDVQTDVTRPPYTWQHHQEELVLKLPASLQRPTNILSRLAISASKSASKRGIQIRGLKNCADLCEAHEGLDPRVIRALIVLLGNEVTARVEGFRRLRESHFLFPPGTEAWLHRLDCILEMWMETCQPAGASGHLPYSHAQQQQSGMGKDQKQRCEACILSVVGGRPQLLADLRANMLARAEVRRSNGDAEPEPRLLRVVEMWIAWYPSVCRAAIGDASDAIKLGIEQLNAERERLKRRRDKKRQGNGNPSRHRGRRRGQRDERGLPISHIQASMEGQHSSHSKPSTPADSDAWVDELVGHVDCAVMSRRLQYDNVPFSPEQEPRLHQCGAASVHVSPKHTGGESRRSDEESLINQSAKDQPVDSQSNASSSSSDSDEEDESVATDRGSGKVGKMNADQPSRAAPSEFTSPSVVPNPLRIRKRVANAVGNASVWTDESVDTWRAAGRPLSNRLQIQKSFKSRADVPTIPEEHSAPGTAPCEATHSQPPSHHRRRRGGGPSSHVPGAPPSSRYSDAPGPPHSPTEATTALPYGGDRKLQPYLDQPEPLDKGGSASRRGRSVASSSRPAGRKELRRGNLERLNEENRKMAKGGADKEASSVSTGP